MTTQDRIIKFRAWDRQNNKFIFSDWKYGEASFWDAICNDFNKQFEQKQQFTGLLDKEGKEIYEGDICKTYEIGIGNLKRVVEFDSGSFVFTHPFCLTSEIRGWKKDFIEVIGNVHQHPELITK